MRFLGVTDTCDLGALYLRLLADGHAVKVAIAYPEARGTMAGMVERVEDWRAELPWIREAGRDGYIIFESVSEGLGALQDQLRAEGYRVIGGSAFGDKLENDRAFAQTLLGELGFPAGHVWEFSDAAKADAFIAAKPARYVLKQHGGSDTYVGQLPDGRDVRAMLASKRSKQFILMEFIEGVEMGVGAYFNGTHFLTPACLDWEHKRFFPADMGELTGEMGTVATFDRSTRFFERTLKRVEPHLRAHGHIGYVNLNTIVNERGIWPLEFTCRFGYPGFAILDPLQRTSWADLFAAMHGDGSFQAHNGFSVGIVISTPPFPYSRQQVDEAIGLPVLIQGDDMENIHLGEVGRNNGQLVTSGLYGWTMGVTGTGETIGLAKQRAYAECTRVFVPNARYRLDIGERLLAGGFARVQALGFLDEQHDERGR